MFSCNDALMQIGAMLGYENYLKYQEIFNFGLKTNIDLPGEANNATTVFNEDTLGVTELATSSFGQGYNTTMIQVASAFSSVINGGYYYQPHVVKKILDADGGTVENIGATLVRQTVSEKTSSLIRQYLYHTMYGEADSNGNNATDEMPAWQAMPWEERPEPPRRFPVPTGNIWFPLSALRRWIIPRWSAMWLWTSRMRQMPLLRPAAALPRRFLRIL